MEKIYYDIKKITNFASEKNKIVIIWEEHLNTAKRLR